MLALLGSLHDLARGLDVLGMVRSFCSVFFLLVLRLHGLLRLCSGVSEPLRYVELPCKLAGHKNTVYLHDLHSSFTRFD